MRIDAHHHVWDLAVRDQPWTAALPALSRSFGLEELLPQLATQRIDATVLVQTVCVREETPELLALAAQWPVVAGVVGWVDLTAADVADQLAALRERPGGQNLVGIRHQVQEEPDPRWLGRADVRHGLAAVAAAELAFDLIVRPDQLPAVIDTVRALPTLRFVLDHAGKPDIAGGALEPWRTLIAELASAPNTAAKLSGLTTQADLRSWTTTQLQPYSDALLARFGPERVMFGSDWPVCLLAGSYKRTVHTALTLTAGLDENEQARVFGETAAHWYRIAA